MPVPWRTDFDFGTRNRPFSLWAAPPTQILDASDRAITLRQLRQLRDYVKRLCKANILRRRVKRLCKANILRRQNLEQQQSKDSDDDDGEDDRRIFWFTINQYDINELVLKKIIPRKGACSWVELVADPTTTSPAAQPPETYVSHAWAESFRDFMLSIEHHARENRVGPDHTYWFCVCANNQWDVTGELSKPLKESPFYHALRKAQQTLLLVDRQGIVMNRAWCLFEWYQTRMELKRPESLLVATGMRMVGSAMVSTGKYVDLLNNLNSKDALTSDPRDLRRIQNSVVGETETQGLDLITRIEASSTGEGRVVVGDQNHSLRDGDTVVYREGIGDPLFNDEGRRIKDGEKFIVKVFADSKELELYHCSNRQDRVILKGGTNGNLMREDYESRHHQWLEDKQGSFQTLDQQVKEQALSGCRTSFRTRHSSGDMVTPVFRAITLAQLRVFAQRTKQRYQDEGWNSDVFENWKQSNRTRLGSNGPGEHYGNEGFSTWNGEWETITWYHVKHLMILRTLQECDMQEDCSFMETMNDKKALRGQYHFSFGWDVPFSEFMDGIEYLAEARQLSDVTPLLIYPLTMNVATRVEYYDATFWEECMNACEAAVIHVGNLNKAGPLLDIHNAVSQNKSIDMMCASGTLALIRPFAAGSWEFGRFDVSAAKDYVTLDVFDATSHDEEYLNRLRNLGREALTKLNRKIRSAGAGPVLREAAYHDNKAMVELVFEKCPWLSIQSVRLQGPLGETPLHIAACNDSVEVLELLLSKSAYVEAIDFDGETPLHLAALAGKTRSARILLRAGADPQHESFFSETPLEVALQKPAYFLIDYGPVLELLKSLEHDLKPLISTPDL